MKTNEAPKKIYSQQNTTTDCYGEWWPEWFEARAKDSDIEYTRTDAFIEKALSWLKNHYKDYMYNPTAKRLKAFFGIDMCNDFENYMKGE